MKSPFPGMDPYLERRWLDLHPRLIVGAANAIQRQLGSDLSASIGERVLVEDVHGYSRRIEPDVRVVESRKLVPGNGGGGGAVATATSSSAVRLTERSEPITERFVEILDRSTGGRVITAIEFVSPSNKVAGEGFTQYRQKQEECFNARVSLVEIDLTRVGDRCLLCHRWAGARDHDSTFQASVWCAWQPIGIDLYRMPLRDRLPTLVIPLRPKDAEVKLDLQPLLDACYADARYDRTIDYTKPPEPPLGDDDAAWARQIIEAARPAER